MPRNGDIAFVHPTLLNAFELLASAALGKHRSSSLTPATAVQCPCTWYQPALLIVVCACLQCLPGLSSFTMMVNIAFILYAVQSPTGYALNTLTPQGAVLVLVAWGIGSCLVTLLSIPLLVSYFHAKAPKPAPVRQVTPQLVPCAPIAL